MLTEQRKQLILNKLRAEGQIVAATLSQQLGLSEDTVRRDLRALAAEGLLQRVHGGALPASPAIATLAERQQVEPAGKLAIARKAAAMVRAGQIVFLDGGTTCQQLAGLLPQHLRATVVTHSPTVAMALSGHMDIEVVLIGGRLFKHSMVAVGAAALDAIQRITADVYFMGVTGISAAAGLTTGDLEEAHIKRALLERAGETWVLASAEKLNAASAYVIAPCAAASGMIVASDTTAADIEVFARQGLDLVYA